MAGSGVGGKEWIRPSAASSLDRHSWNRNGGTLSSKDAGAISCKLFCESTHLFNQKIFRISHRQEAVSFYPMYCKLLKRQTIRAFFQRLSALLLLVAISATAFVLPAQSTTGLSTDDGPPAVDGILEADYGPGFRVEKVSVPGGSELITIFARQRPAGATLGPIADLPLVTVLRDTLGDEKRENDRLRYVWMHTYTEPSIKQKIAGFVPFLYMRTRNKTEVGTDPAPPIIELNGSDKNRWNSIFWMIFKRLNFDGVGLGIHASTLQYRQNVEDYRKTAIASALTVLSLYQNTVGEKVLSDQEMKDIQARLFLSDKMFGWHMQSENLGRVYEKGTTITRDYRGHNWELLRQYAEAQGLYFDPLEMPDGSPRHAILWVAATDILANKGKTFERRFLNIRSPWGDRKLAAWKGYTQVRWYDAEDREVEAQTPGARPKTLIPLALYGLDHPKVPIILIDFRDNGNPKLREISRRILNDLTGNVLSLTELEGFPFFVARFIYEFVSGRRGADLNQESRRRSYSQLKLLLSLDASLDVEFRDSLARRVESATLNPLQNDADIEMKLARQQYANLLAWAARPDGLARKIENDRREEMVRLVHGSHDRVWFALGHLITFGRYTHREEPTPELTAKMDIRRQLDYHERFLREVAFRSSDPSVDTDAAALKNSLMFVSQHGSKAGSKTTRAVARIFDISHDQEMRELALAGLYRINNSSAKKQLLAIYKDEERDIRWRNICANYLKLALKEGQRISKRDAKDIAGMASN